MTKNVFLFSLSLIFFSCSQQQNLKTADKEWLAAIIKNSDSSYTKPYYRSDFVTAEYYMNKKDSTVCQLMKDSANVIRQVIISRKNIRTYFAHYYSNGQLQADLLLDGFGQYHGSAKYFFENGHIQNSGNYTHGLKTGEWKNYNESGSLVSTDEYDQNGQLVKTSKP